MFLQTTVGNDRCVKTCVCRLNQTSAELLNEIRTLWLARKTNWLDIVNLHLKS